MFSAFKLSLNSESHYQRTLLDEGHSVAGWVIGGSV